MNNSRDLNLNDLIWGSIAVWSVSSTVDCILISRQHRKLSQTLAVVAQPSPNLTPRCLWHILTLMHPFTQCFPTNSIEGHQLRGWSLSQRSWGMGWGVVSLQQGQHGDSRVFWAEVVSFSNGICSESQLFLCYLMFSYLVLLHFVYNAFWPLFVKGTLKINLTFLLT